MEHHLNDLIDRHQIKGIWPINYPLPLPQWQPNKIKPYHLATLREYEQLASTIEIRLQHLLEQHNYNTVGNFLSFYRNFKHSKCCNLVQFFRR